MNRINHEIEINYRKVGGYLSTTDTIGIALLDSELRILANNVGFMRLFNPRRSPVGDLLSDYIELDVESIKCGEQLRLSCSRKSHIEAVNYCHLIETETGYILFCERQLLTESRVLGKISVMSNELINLQREMVKKNHLLKKQEAELQEQNEELKMTEEKLRERIMERTEELHFQAVELEQEIAERQLAQERLQVQATQLEKLNETLEQRVQERTTELSERNTEISQAYDELKMAQSQLLHQDKMASIGNLAAGVAHEINNPMGYIISNLSSLSKYVDKLTTYLDANEQYFSGRDPDAWEHLVQERKKYKIDRVRQDLPELIAESHEGAERVRKIVQDLKNFSRIDNSSFEFSDINDGLESTLTIAWNELKYKATVNKVFGQLPQIWCNMGQINQVFLNILLNAAHAIEEQGEISIATWEEKESVRITISDNGGGISPENVKHIFDPFFTTKEVGKGTGLGLSIAYDIIVNKHGGNIDVTSEIGMGTTFTISLPVKREQSKTTVE